MAVLFSGRPDRAGFQMYAGRIVAEFGGSVNQFNTGFKYVSSLTFPWLIENKLDCLIAKAIKHIYGLFWVHKGVPVFIFIYRIIAFR